MLIYILSRGVAQDPYLRSQDSLAEIAQSLTYLSSNGTPGLSQYLLGDRDSHMTTFSQYLDTVAWLYEPECIFPAVFRVFGFYLLLFCWGTGKIRPLSFYEHVVKKLNWRTALGFSSRIFPKTEILRVSYPKKYEEEDKENCVNDH